MVVLSPRTPDKAEDFQEALLDAGAPQRAGLTEAEHAAMVGASLAWPCPEALCQAGIRMLQCNPAYRDAVQIMPVSMWAVIECGMSAGNWWACVAQARSALEENTGEGAEAKGQNHLWDFILDGTNMLIRSATLQVQSHQYCPAMPCAQMLLLLRYSDML